MHAKETWFIVVTVTKFIYSFNKYFSNACDASGSVLGAGYSTEQDSASDLTTLCSHGASILVGGDLEKSQDMCSRSHS